jgi:hypothetical protein
MSFLRLLSSLNLSRQSESAFYASDKGTCLVDIIRQILEKICNESNPNAMEEANLLNGIIQFLETLYQALNVQSIMLVNLILQKIIYNFTLWKNIPSFVMEFI